MKKLGPANDKGVSPEELTLAAMLQSANARGLEWTSGTYFRGKSGKPWVKPENAVSCCAYGAFELDPIPFGCVFPCAASNDNPDETAYGGPESTLGHAFRQAMTED